MTTYIHQLFDSALLQNCINERLISDREWQGVSVLNYTPAAVGTEWNEATLACRGLIYDIDTGEVLARPFNKFFNLTEPHKVPERLNGDVVCLPKFDGSLGIIYKSKNGLAVSTRGSAKSDQAIWATEWLRQNWPDWRPPAGVTVLVEIIYPQNRIVVDFEGYEGLVCIGARDIDSGLLVKADKLPTLWPGEVATAIPTEFTIEDLKSVNPEVAAFVESLPMTPQFQEGCVFVCYDPDYLVKVKREEYLRLHRCLFGLTEKTVWQSLCETGSYESCLVDGLPDEAEAWVLKVGRNLILTALITETDARRVFAEINAKTSDRKSFAIEATSQSDVNPALLFSMLDGTDRWHDMIWKSLEPGYMPFSGAAL